MKSKRKKRRRARNMTNRQALALVSRMRKARLARERQARKTRSHGPTYRRRKALSEHPSVHAFMCEHAINPDKLVVTTKYDPGYVMPRSNWIALQINGNTVAGIWKKKDKLGTYYESDTFGRMYKTIAEAKAHTLEMAKAGRWGRVVSNNPKIQRYTSSHILGWEIKYQAGLFIATKHGVRMRARSRDLITSMIEKRSGGGSKTNSKNPRDAAALFELRVQGKGKKTLVKRSRSKMAHSAALKSFWVSRPGGYTDYVLLEVTGSPRDQGWGRGYEIVSTGNSW